MVYSELIGHVLPERCPGCAGPSASGFCRGCRDDFAQVPDPCARCGLSLPALQCPRATARWWLDGVVAPLRYSRPVSTYIQALKFSGARSIGRAFGEVLAVRLAQLAADREIDAIVAVPLHRPRLLERGYNQALEIARPVAARLRIPLLTTGITRKRATPAQATLGSGERHSNLADAFRITRRCAGLRIAVIDDVITTGATVNALAQEILRADANTATAWAVARAL
jgi:ComF family protein